MVPSRLLALRSRRRGPRASHSHRGGDRWRTCTHGLQLPEVRDYLEWVTTADRDGMPVPRIEPERARISRMRAEDRAEAARAFQEALLPKLLILQDETGR
jgi:hypothetical protein